MLALLPVLSACLIGCLAMRWLRPADGAGPAWAAALFHASLGVGFGIGFASIVFFLLVTAGLAAASVILATDLALLLALLAALYLRSRRGAQSARSTPSQPRTPGFRYNWALALALSVCLIFVLSGMRSQAAANPHGGWDAYAIWNLRARFLAGPGDTWRHAISPLLDKTHPDYPLLLSGFIARSWKVAGNYHIVAPLATALLFFLSALGLLVSALALLRGASTGLLASLVLMAGYTYLNQPWSQYSDVPLSFYYLAAIALASLAMTPGGKGKPLLLVLAGLAAGFAAWTKNEGLLFIAAFGLCYSFTELLFSGWKQAMKRSLWMALGMMPGLLLAGWLKFALAPVADPVVREGHDRIAKGVASQSNLLRVWRWSTQSLLTFGYTPFTHPLLPLAALAAALRISLARSFRPAVLSGGATLLLVFAGYVVVSIGAFTPFDRFYSQLFPALLFVFFLALRAPEECAAAATPDQPAAGSLKKSRKKKARS